MNICKKAERGKQKAEAESRGMPVVMKQQQDEKPEKASEECSPGSVTFWGNQYELVFPRRSQHKSNL